MKTIFERTHFDKNKQPKTFRVSYNEPEYNSRIKEGSFVISIMSKGNAQGFLLSTDDIADLDTVLSMVRTSLLTKTLKLYEQEAKE